MKNSAWYQKLWHKKLSGRPLHKDAVSAWDEMSKILDKQLPASHRTSGHSVKPSGIKLVSLLGYILPAAAMIAAAGYFTLFLPTGQNTDQKKKKQASHIEKDTTSISRMKADKFPLKEEKVFIVDSGATRNKKQIWSPGLNTPQKPSRSEGIPGMDTSILNNLVKSKNHYFASTTGQSNPGVISSPSQKSVPNEAEYTAIKLQESIDEHALTNADIPTTEKKIASNKTRSAKPEKKKKPGSRNEQEITSPPYSYGLETGLNLGGEQSFYLGASASYALKKRWLLTAGLRINGQKQLSGAYSHPSFYRPDSLPDFKVIDKRKLLMLDIPLTVEYRISNAISVKAGPLISFLLKQSDVSSKLAPIADDRDTVYHSQEINNAISKTAVNKINIGFTGGISFHFKQFDLDGRYQVFPPYQISNDLGSYRKANHYFQIGIGYRFKLR